jgi:adenylate cyclase
LGKLVPLRNRLLAVVLVAILMVLAAGWLVLRGVKRAHSRIVKESLKMNAFDFSPAPTESGFRDVSEVLESMEKAKTAMRAMGKYVPVDLVRRLYQGKREPTLGGQSMDISIMFTDIKDFTTLSEQLAPDVLANALGRYLDMMARIIQKESRGTIDKYIGDAIMTLWNAPEALEQHSRMACHAALQCRDAGRALAASAQWEGLPPFETRFGLHRGTALVGHFGAHDRMNYTAIGDAVNLASRLEGLNKEYGTTVIVSETIREAAQEAFEFRLLDLVRVKGKHQPVQIYELLASKGGDSGTPGEVVADYERAFALYTSRNFKAAGEILERHPSDRPSAVVLKRSRFYLESPPSEQWDGVFEFTSK